MTFIFQVSAPDGTTEFIGPRGEVFTRDEAEAVPFPAQSRDEAEDEQFHREKLWSARGDCFVQDSQLIEL